MPLPIVRRLLLVSWMPWSLAPTVPPVPVMAMSPPPASSVAPVRATPTKVPVDAPALLPASVIGAPFEVSAPVATMLRVPVRSIALPAPPLIVASAIVKVCAVATSLVKRRDGTDGAAEGEGAGRARAELMGAVDRVVEGDRRCAGVEDGRPRPASPRCRRSARRCSGPSRR